MFNRREIKGKLSDFGSQTVGTHKVFLFLFSRGTSRQFKTVNNSTTLACDKRVT